MGYTSNQPSCTTGEGKKESSTCFSDSAPLPIQFRNGWAAQSWTSGSGRKHNVLQTLTAWMTEWGQDLSQPATPHHTIGARSSSSLEISWVGSMSSWMAMKLCKHMRTCGSVSNPCFISFLLMYSFTTVCAQLSLQMGLLQPQVVEQAAHFTFCMYDARCSANLEGVERKPLGTCPLSTLSQPLEVALFPSNQNALHPLIFFLGAHGSVYPAGGMNRSVQNSKQQCRWSKEAVNENIREYQVW